MIFVNGLPTLLIFINADVVVGFVVLLTLSIHPSESEPESESLLLVVERFRLIKDLSEGVVGGFVFMLFCGVLLVKRRGGEDFETGTAELESLSL